MELVVTSSLPAYSGEVVIPPKGRASSEPRTHPPLHRTDMPRNRKHHSKSPHRVTDKIVHEPPPSVIETCNSVLSCGQLEITNASEKAIVGTSYPSKRFSSAMNTDFPLREVIVHEPRPSCSTEIPVNQETPSSCNNTDSFVKENVSFPNTSPSVAKESVSSHTNITTIVQDAHSTSAVQEIAPSISNTVQEEHTASCTANLRNLNDKEINVVSKEPSPQKRISLFEFPQRKSHYKHKFMRASTIQMFGDEQLLKGISFLPPLNPIKPYKLQNITPDSKITGEDKKVIENISKTPNSLKLCTEEIKADDVVVRISSETETEECRTNQGIQNIVRASPGHLLPYDVTEQIPEENDELVAIPKRRKSSHKRVSIKLSAHRREAMSDETNTVQDAKTRRSSAGSFRRKWSMSSGEFNSCSESVYSLSPDMEEFHRQLANTNSGSTNNSEFITAESYSPCSDTYETGTDISDNEQELTLVPDKTPEEDNTVVRAAEEDKTVLAECMDIAISVSKIKISCDKDDCSGNTHETSTYTNNTKISISSDEMSTLTKSTEEKFNIGIRDRMTLSCDCEISEESDSIGQLLECNTNKIIKCKLQQDDINIVENLETDNNVIYENLESRSIIPENDVAYSVNILHKTTEPPDTFTANKTVSSFSDPEVCSVDKDSCDIPDRHFCTHYKVIADKRREFLKSAQSSTGDSGVSCNDGASSSYGAPSTTVTDSNSVDMITSCTLTISSISEPDNEKAEILSSNTSEEIKSLATSSVSVKTVNKGKVSNREELLDSKKKDSTHNDKCSLL